MSYRMISLFLRNALTVLDISNNPLINSLDRVSHLIILEILRLVGNYLIGDLSPIKHISSIRILDCGCFFGLYEIPRESINLESISLQSASITKLDHIKNSDIVVIKYTWIYHHYLIM